MRTVPGPVCRSLAGLTLAATVALAASGCATTMTVSSHVQHGLDVTPYRTYDWGPADALPTGDPRLDANPFFKDHIEGAVDKMLAGRGLERSAGGRADLLIHYHASVTHGLEVERWNGTNAYCSGDACGRVTDFEAGTIVLDVVDARTDRVIWRGWAQDRLHNMLDTPDRMARSINAAVAGMLERFPIPAPDPSKAAVAGREDQR